MKVKPIRKFSIDYRRYLGAAFLFAMLVLVLAKCSGPVERKENPEDTQAQDLETEGGNTQEVLDLEGEIEKAEDEELLALIGSVYRAYVNNDVAVLEACYSQLSDNEKSYIETFAEYKEEYRNLDCYALKVGEGAYFVSPCYDLKFYGIETAAPGMDFFYVHRNDAGRLIVDSAYTTYNFNFMEQELDAGIYAKILAYNRREEITDLQKMVQSNYDAAVASDENLANLIGGMLRNAMIQWQNKISAGGEEDTENTENTEDTGNTEENTEDTENSGNTEEDSEILENTETQAPPEPPQPATYQVRARVNCNIRAESSKNSERIGHAELGDLFTAIGEDGEWTIIEYQGGVGYIRSDLIRKVE